LKFTQNGKISINISKQKTDDSEVTLLASVKDTGIGIPKDKLGILFKPFSQVDVSYKRLFGGTGLGLRICKEFVHLMNGEINVESEEGKGSNFFFTSKFKIKGGQEFQKVEKNLEAVPDCPDSSRDIKIKRGKFNILVVEDNEISSSIQDRILKDAGYNVTSVKTGKEAVEKASERSFNLITMDIRMPGMDGFETTKAIRELNDKYKSVPIIVITAVALKEEADKFLSNGMDDIIYKPFKIAYFLEKIDGWLKIPNSHVSS
jgi:CheY-like chemotaxis protein